jgi:Ni/Co efflux regulator RcnB
MGAKRFGELVGCVGERTEVKRLRSHYHKRQYVVDNCRAHRLSAPPRGYHWVQVGGDYVLAAVATGIIASVLLGN